MGLVKYQNGWAFYDSVSATSVNVTNATALDMREFSRCSVIASSTAGTPTLTVWTAASSTSAYRLMKTSTGGAIAITTVANAQINLPAGVGNGSLIKLQTSGATISNLRALLKK